MVNKRGWLRIVEALISILVVFGAVLTVSTTSPPSAKIDLCDSLSPLLDEIAKNITLRTEIINGYTKGTEAFLANKIKNPALDREIKICEPEDIICPHSKSGLDNVNICAKERIIGSSFNEFKPMKLKVFLFEI